MRRLIRQRLFWSNEICCINVFNMLHFSNDFKLKTIQTLSGLFLGMSRLAAKLDESIGQSLIFMELGPQSHIQWMK
jgi:hypothetical protein